MNPRKDRIKTFYTILSRDDSYDRACQVIPDTHCTHLPLNYVLNVINGAASKLAEQVAGAKLVLPWLLSTMGTPAGFIGFLLPLRQAGALLPQLAVSGQIRRFPIRKWFWVVAAFVQVLMLMLMIGAAVVFSPLAAGMVIGGCLLLFSIARGMGSIAFQDVTGKTVPKGRRGRMLAARGMIGGLLTIAVGVGISGVKNDAGDVRAPLILLFCGAILWSISALAFAGIREAPGATAGGRNALREAMAGLGFMLKSSWFFRYLAARAMLLSVELATPFYVLLVNEMLPGKSGTLGLIVIAAGLAQSLSSPFWGRFADLSSRKVLLLSGLLAALTGGVALTLGRLPDAFQNPYVYAVLFVLIGFSEAGVLLGRKTFLIDTVDPSERTTYVAFANTTMGLVTLLFGFFGMIAQFYSVQTLIAALVVLGAGGAGASWLLPETSAKETA